MGLFRWYSLSFGPLLIVSLLYWLTMAENGPSRAGAETSSPSADGAPGIVADDDEALEILCRQTAGALHAKLGTPCRVRVHSPFVLGGNLSEERLDEIHRETILPTAQALATGFFDTPPDQPVTILLFAGEPAYRGYAALLDGRERANYYGYYNRDERRILLNISTGNGTLAHELTHALAHFDFPGMPEWFDEGLASLFEQSRFSADGLRLEGISNWRIQYLLRPARQNRLQSLEMLMQTETVRTDREAVHYAHARYFCLYLQSRELLEPFYRKFRHRAYEDPTGIETLKALLRADSLDEIDRDFRRWLLSQKS